MSGHPLMDMTALGNVCPNGDRPRWREKYVEWLCQGLKKHLKNNVYSDVTIIVENKTFRCHKVILSSVSPYFEAMFASDMKEAHNETIELIDMESEMFEKVLEFIYAASDVVDTENVSSLLQAAALLQIQPLQDRCESFMLDKIDNDNCIATWKLASGVDCKVLAQKAFIVILQEFANLWQSHDFLALDKKELIDLIRDNNLNIPNEETVCDAAIRWMTEGNQSRLDSVADIVEKLRLPLVQPEYLLEVLERKSFIRNCEACRGYIEEAKRYHLLPARRQEFVSPRLEYRNFGDFEEVIVCLGGSDEQTKTSSQVTCYSFLTRQWYDLASLPYNPGVEFATCAYGNAIFVSGGSTHMHGMVYYMSTHNKWEMCQTMLLGRRRHMMVASGECIYVIGGYDDTADDDFKTLLTIEAFYMSTGCWEDAGYLALPVRSASAAVSGEHIYIFGGVTNNDYDTKAIQCYDTRQRSCTIIVGELPSFCRLSVAIAYQHTIYIVSQTGDVMQCDENNSVLVRGNIPDFERHNFGLILRNGCVLILGGSNSEGDNFDEVYNFDLSTNASSLMVDYLPTQMYGFGCVKAVINKKYLCDPTERLSFRWY